MGFAGDGKFKRCESCGAPFYVPNKGGNSKRKFCDDPCKQRHWESKHKPRDQSNSGDDKPDA
jgi:hypothetical protein